MKKNKKIIYIISSVLIIFLLLISIIVLVNNKKSALRCSINNEKDSYVMKDDVILLFKNKSLVSKKEVITVKFKETAKNSVFDSIKNGFVENGDNFKKLGWSYEIKDVKEGLEFTLYGDGTVDEIKNDVRTLNDYKNYYKHLNYSCK